MKLIRREFNAIGQKATFTKIVVAESSGLRLRAHIIRDSYDAQSYGYVDVWSSTDNRWNHVHNLEAGDPVVCGLPTSYAYRAAVQADGPNAAVVEGKFEVVADDLIELARSVAL